MHVQTQRLTGGRTCRRWRGSSTELGTTTNCGGTRGRLCEHCTALHCTAPEHGCHMHPCHIVVTLLSHASVSHRCHPPVTCIRVTSLSHPCHIVVTLEPCHIVVTSHITFTPCHIVSTLLCHMLLHRCHDSVVTCLSVYRYPAGFVYIYSIFYHVTERGALIGRAQCIFALLYLLNLALVCNIYRKTAKASTEY